MSETDIHTFAADDSRARVTLHGRSYRATRIFRSWSTGYSQDPEIIGVDFIQTTKTGADRKRGPIYIWESQAWLERNTGPGFAAYVQELIAATIQS